MLAPATHFYPLTTIRRERVLPIPGRLVVRKGQKVSTNDALAETNLNPRHLIVDIGRGLGLPPEKADTHIQCKAGAQIEKDDVIAGPVGLTRRVVRAPEDGRVILAGSGQVLMEVKSEPFELKAGFSGVVVELLEGRGAVVETSGALVQGVWGNGLIDAGMLAVVISEPEETLTARQLEVGLRGAVVVGGHVEDAAVLQAAEDLPLRGLVISSLNPNLVGMAEGLSMPVVILEGFGKRAMNPVVYKLFSSHDSRETAVNAEAWDPHRGTRPEVVIAVPVEVPPASPPAHLLFSPGQTVRVVRAPYAGQTGKLTRLRGIAALPNGLQAPAAEVRLDGGESALLPLANLEVLPS